MKQVIARTALVLAMCLTVVGAGQVSAQASGWTFYGWYDTVSSPGCWDTGFNGYQAGWWDGYYCQPHEYVNLEGLWVHLP